MQRVWTMAALMAACTLAAAHDGHAPATAEGRAAAADDHVSAAHNDHAPATQGGRTILQRQPLPDAPGRYGVMLTVDYAPGEASPAHRHPGSVFAYVLEGEVQSQLDDGAIATYKAGQSWVETPRVLHAVSRNASHTRPARLLVWLTVGEGEQPTVPAAPIGQ